jgi:phospholipid/cholesterol/gamma-HCH transport system substrate-binding protein
MDRNVNYLIVGLFVIVGLAAGAVFLFWLSTTTGTQPLERFTVNFEDPINGLAIGSAVRYRGVEVGKVIDVRLDRERPSLIKVDIEINALTPISSATTARLKPQGITGLAFIEISTVESADAMALEREGEPYPVIRGLGSQIERFIDDLPKVTAQAIDLVDRLQVMLSPRNIERVSQTLRNIENLSRDLNGLLGSENVSLVQGNLQNLRGLTRDLNGLLSEENVANLSRALRLVAAHVQDLQPLVVSLRESAANIERSTASVARILTRNEAAIDRFTGRGLDEIAGLVRDSRDMVDTVRQLADKLSENPSQLIFPPSYKGIVIGQ